ncbi:MAG TPA: MATE family efflux transporter [Acholeplasma sp.]|nr:MATE family efflux transporter [Acholeplasma sp.]
MKKLIGSKMFYREVIAIVIPIMIQQGITMFVGLLDNIMVGRLNVDAIAGVSIANQIIFIVTIALVGGLAGPGIFIAQYYGAKNEDALKQAFRAKMILALIITTVAMTVLFLFGDVFVRAFAKNDDQSLGVYNEVAIKYGLDYLRIITFGLPLLAGIQLYASTFREVAQTKVPMFAGIISVSVNLMFNSVLIFGLLGFPRLEVAGAATATLIARFFEFGILLFVAYKYRLVFTIDIFKKFTIEKKRFKLLVKKSLPLLTNELLWSSSMTLLLWAYSQRGTSVTAAYNISNTVANLFFIIFGALATGISVMVGNELGANQIEKAKENAYKLLFFSVMVCLGFGVILASIAPFVPYLYNVTDSVRTQATQFMWVISALMWIFAFNAGCFFILRAGGMVFLTLFFDSFFSWIVVLPIAIYFSLFTNMPVILIYIMAEATNIIKAFIGFNIVRHGKWAKNLTYQ